LLLLPPPRVPSENHDDGLGGDGRGGLGRAPARARKICGNLQKVGDQWLRERPTGKDAARAVGPAYRLLARHLGPGGPGQGRCPQPSRVRGEWAPAHCPHEHAAAAGGRGRQTALADPGTALSRTRRQVAMHLIDKVKCGLALPSFVTAELRASAEGASFAGGGTDWPDDDDGFADFTGASDVGGDDDFGDFGGAFQAPGTAAAPSKRVLTKDLIGAYEAAPPNLPPAASASTMDDLLGAAPVSTSWMGRGAVDMGAHVGTLLATSAGSAALSPAVQQSPIVSKAALVADLFAESFKPQPKMRDMKSPSSSTAPRSPLAASPAGSSMQAFAPRLGSETNLLAGGKMQPTPSITNQSALVFELFTDLLQKDGIIEAAPAFAFEEDFGDFFSDAAAFWSAGEGGGALQAAAPAGALSEAFSQFGVADDDFGADLGAFEGGAAVSGGQGVVEGGQAGRTGGGLDPNAIQKGGIFWYRDTMGGVEKQVEVVAIDRSVRPPSFAIRVDGRERETEAHRLSLQQSSLPSLSVGQGAVHGTVPAAVDADWGAFGDDDFQGADDDFGADFGENDAKDVPGSLATVAGNHDRLWDFGDMVRDGLGGNSGGTLEVGGGGQGQKVEEMTTAVAEVTESLIQELVQMGFARDRAEVALMKSGMDLEEAARWLLGDDGVDTSASAHAPAPFTPAAAAGAAASSRSAAEQERSSLPDLFRDMGGDMLDMQHGADGWVSGMDRSESQRQTTATVQPLQRLAQTDSDDDFGDFTEYEDGNGGLAPKSAAAFGEVGAAGDFDFGADFGADDADFGDFSGAEAGGAGASTRGGSSGGEAKSSSAVVDAFASLLEADGILGMISAFAAASAAAVAVSLAAVLR
jgi:hypothetical protein